ncbi:MAG: hypothetical protein ACI9DG_001577, partial [Oleispira sp.]
TTTKNTLLVRTHLSLAAQTTLLTSSNVNVLAF